MKKFVGITSTLTLLLFLGVVGTAHADALFTDGFESGDLSAWTSAGTNWTTVNNAAGAHTGDYRGQIEGDTEGDSSLLAETSTAGFENILLTFWYQLVGLDEGDEVIVEWFDGLSWNELDIFAGVSGSDDDLSEWTEWSMDIPSDADDNTDFAVRFRANLDAGSDTFKIDDVDISGDAIEEPEPEPDPEPSDNPEDKSDCKKGGWETFGFSNQGQCIRFLNTGTDSR